MVSQLVWLRKGTVTSPKGFLAAGHHAGIKPGREKDMALVVSATLPCSTTA